ncbi:cytochrome d ubiquinol oxidase subunit II [Oryzifoliimicrobium ureilyticus]|uniref:cytochrome d ubiquinol oxidase subunit II n=1 Tax=Oryzifoliimicrobium ureilyticus TaxID=3113724 RepID=UPI003076749E
MHIDLALVWAGIIAFAVLAYVIMDGFDLGVGLLFPFLGSKEDRDLAMNSVAPVWDGNETWLVLGGGGLFAVFPLAYSTIMPALYAPIILMLLGLIFRGVAFEYRWRTRRAQHIWDLGFFIGSLTAAFCQGICLGTLVQGISVSNRAYSGQPFDWLTPFSIATGLALVGGYALLGSTWLIAKTHSDMSNRLRPVAIILATVTVILMGVFSLWTPFIKDLYLERWFGYPTVVFSVIVPVVVAVLFYSIVRGLRSSAEWTPFLCALGLFMTGYAGIGISFYPYIVPQALTIWQAAAPPSSLKFLLVGAAVLVPIILTYTAYAYWVFRGKVDPHGGYH